MHDDAPPDDVMPGDTQEDPTSRTSWSSRFFSTLKGEDVPEDVMPDEVPEDVMPDDIQEDFTPRLNEDNADPRVACAILLDVSKSMQNEPIRALNEGLARFCEDIKEDTLARKRTEVMLITFNSSVEVVQEFCEARELEPVTLTASGGTAMGEAINVALDRIAARKKQYQDAGLEYFRPWLWLITDGYPGDSAQVWNTAVQRLRDTEKAKGVAVFAVGVGKAADMNKLAELSAERQPVRLQGLKFAEMFTWLSSSMSTVSSSQQFGTSDSAIAASDHEQTPLEPPTGWAQW